MYGLFGLLLIPFFFRADRTLKIWTRVVFLISSAALFVVAVFLLVAEQILTEASLQTPMESRFDEVLLNGTFIEAIPARLELWLYGISTGVILQGGFAFAAFLLGLRMARTQFLSSPIDVNQNSKLIKRGILLGAPIQILAALALVQNEQSADPSEAVHLFALTVSFISAPLLSMFFVGVIRKLVEEKPNTVSWIKPAGQMSLTVYISQSVITSMIFGPWGLGLFQDLQTWQVLILAFGIWGLLVYLSTIWLKKYKQGPLEKLVHSVTKDR